MAKDVNPETMVHAKFQADALNPESTIPANGNTELSTVSPANTEGRELIQMIGQLAMNPDVNVEKMQAIVNMKEGLFNRQLEIEFNEAMARVQAQILPIVRDAENKQTKSRYTKLETIVAAISPIYTAEGFALSFDTDVCPVPEHAAAGWFRVICEISRSGHTKRRHVDLPPDIAGIQGNVNKTGLHGFKSTLTYGRNMLICMIFNVVLKDEDNDGNQPGHVVEPDITDWLTVIRDSTTLEELQKQFKEAYKENSQYKNNVRLLTVAKDSKKKELANV